MHKEPKHKIALIMGVVLFVAGPFLFIASDFRFLCTPEDTAIFACSNKALVASFVLSVISFIIGVVLILWALRINSHKK